METEPKQKHVNHAKTIAENFLKGNTYFSCIYKQYLLTYGKKSIWDNNDTMIALDVEDGYYLEVEFENPPKLNDWSQVFHFNPNKYLLVNDKRQYFMTVSDNPLNVSFEEIKCEKPWFDSSYKHYYDRKFYKIDISGKKISILDTSQGDDASAWKLSEHEILGGSFHANQEYTVIHNNKIYIIASGYEYEDEDKDEDEDEDDDEYEEKYFELYAIDLETMALAKLDPSGDLPSRREGATLTATDGKLYLYGGSDIVDYYSDSVDLYEAEDIGLNGLWAYDTALNKCSQVSLSLNYESVGYRKDHSALSYKGDLIIFGGYYPFIDRNKLERVINRDRYKNDDFLKEKYLTEVERIYLESESEKQNLDVVYDPSFGNGPLYNQDDTKDLTFIVEGGYRVPAHRSILVQRCDFFKNMLESGMKEASQQEIELPWTDSETLQVLLRYLYTNKVECSNYELLVKVLKLSDILAMAELAKICENLLVKNLNTKNCLSILEVGEQYDRSILIDESENNIAENILAGNFKDDQIEEMPQTLLVKVIKKMQRKYKKQNTGLKLLQESHKKLVREHSGCCESSDSDRY